MTNKTKNFSFNTEEKDIFQNQPKTHKNLGGRPTKNEAEKLSIQKTIKFTESEHETLNKQFESVKHQFSSFASYLRYLIFQGQNKSE